MAWLRGMGFVVLAGTLVSAAGCGGSQGPPRYALSGAVTHGGKPVPAGYITFTPDSAKGHTGPGAQAEIRNGRYAMAAGQGTLGGPHVITVYGFDGQAFDIGGGRQNPQGQPLFSGHRFEVDLPKQTATHDFAVPAAGR